MRHLLSVVFFFAVVSLSLSGYCAASEQVSAVETSISLGKVPVHVIYPKGKAVPKVSVRHGGYTCQVGCSDGSTAEASCSNGQACCGNAITCQAWCHTGDASGCGSSP
jgi:hypothetical protein